MVTPVLQPSPLARRSGGSIPARSPGIAHIGQALTIPWSCREADGVVGREAGGPGRSARATDPQRDRRALVGTPAEPVVTGAGVEVAQPHPGEVTHSPVRRHPRQAPLRRLLGVMTGRA